MESLVLDQGIKSEQPVSAPPGIWSMPALTGEMYRLVLRRFHEVLKPETYLEIGVDRGETLALADFCSIAIDPSFKLKEVPINKKPSCFFFAMTSDVFFKSQDPTRLFGKPIDMAFLDGMHWFEFLLRDFINVEKHCKPNSVIFLHDCFPIDEHVGRRHTDNLEVKQLSKFPEWWAGDVWKVVDILMKHRPDLSIYALDAVPTGLIAITGLNPRSAVLSDAYFDLIAEYRDITLADRGNEYVSRLGIMETRRFATRASISGAFWL